MNTILASLFPSGKVNGGIIHVGAHGAEEMELYESFGPDWIVWAEANPALWQTITDRMSNSSVPQCLIRSAISDRTGTVPLNLASRSDANSIMPPDVQYPPVLVASGGFQVETTTLDAGLAPTGLNLTEARFLVIDTEGSELLALSGAVGLLAQPHLTAVCVEMFDARVFVGQPTEASYTAFLEPFGFELTGKHVDPGGVGVRYNLVFTRD